MEGVVFAAAAAIILGGALGVVLSPNPVHSALMLVATLFGVAVIFVQQDVADVFPGIPIPRATFLNARGAPPPLALARRLRASLGPQALFLLPCLERPGYYSPAHPPEIGTVERILGQRPLLALGSHKQRDVGQDQHGSVPGRRISSQEPDVRDEVAHVDRVANQTIQPAILCIRRSTNTP